MRTLRRSAIIISLMTLALSSPGHAACGPGYESCEPSADEVRAKVERLFEFGLADTARDSLIGKIRWS